MILTLSNGNKLQIDLSHVFTIEYETDYVIITDRSGRQKTYAPINSDEATRLQEEFESMQDWRVKGWDK